MNHARLHVVGRLKFHPFHRRGIGFGHGQFHLQQLFLGQIGVLAQRIVAHDFRISVAGFLAKPWTQVRVRVSLIPEGLIRFAVQGILADQTVIPICRGRERALVMIVFGRYPLSLRQYFLDLAQLLLRLYREFGVGVLGQEIAAFLFGAQRVVRIAVGLFHLPDMDLANLRLRFRRFGHRWVEQLEIFVFRLRLR